MCVAHLFAHGLLQGGVVWSPLRALGSEAASLVGSWLEDCTLELLSGDSMLLSLLGTW